MTDSKDLIAVAENVLGMEIPVVPGLHIQILDALENGGTLEMDRWHGKDSGDLAAMEAGVGFCGTTHCRAGWTTHLAGEQGRALEKRLTDLWIMGSLLSPGWWEKLSAAGMLIHSNDGPVAAAAELIIRKSCPGYEFERNMFFPYSGATHEKTFKHIQCLAKFEAESSEP